MIPAKTRPLRSWRAVRAALLVTLVAALTVGIQPRSVSADQGGNSAFTAEQRAVLYGIASDTWKFFSTDIDPNTNLPLDNIGPGATRGAYTSAANIGVYLWAVVAANDLGLIGRPEARTRIEATLNTVSTLKRYDGFLFQWYDTTTTDPILNPGQADCSTETTPKEDNCTFLSAVDNGWYASGLVVARSAIPELRHLVDSLLAPMNFGIFYDNGPQTQ